MKSLTLSKGQITTVDDCDYDFINSYGNWYTSIRFKDHAYAIKVMHVKKDNGKWTTTTIHLSHLIAIRKYGNIPDDMIVDHIDHNTLNNTRDNIRVVTKSQSIGNRRKLTKTKSKLKGPIWYERQQKWIVRPMLNNKRYYLGAFDDEQKAADVYKEFIDKHRGEFGCTESLAT